MMRLLLMFCLVFQVAFGDEAQEYTVSGSVARPAELAWEKGLTLEGAIKAAGGTTKEADLKQVTLVRNKKSDVYDLGNETHRGVKIYSGDVIEVKQVGFVRKIRAWQILQIGVTGVPDIEKMRLETTYKVDAKGMLTMWKIGAIKAQGKTKPDLAKALTAAYKAAEIYDAAVFQVFSDDGVLDHQAQMFTIRGQVRSPGQKQWTNGITLYGAIQLAGGETPYGALNRVELFRSGKVYVYNPKRQNHKGVKVYARDIIEVPQRKTLDR